MTYQFSGNVLGAPDVTVFTTIAPGLANLPGNVLEPQLGEIRTAWDPTYGQAEFIYLKVPANLAAIPQYTLVTWTAGYTVAVLPVLATSKNTLSPVAVAPVATVLNASLAQYGWFQIQGQTPVLKTAVAVAPNVVVYASGTAGRLKVLTSAGGQILGMRSFNSATVTTTTSSVLCYLNRPQMQGQVT